MHRSEIKHHAAFASRRSLCARLSPTVIYYTFLLFWLESEELKRNNNNSDNGKSGNVEPLRYCFAVRIKTEPETMVANCKFACGRTMQTTVDGGGERTGETPKTFAILKMQSSV